MRPEQDPPRDSVKRGPRVPPQSGSAAAKGIPEVSRASPRRPGVALELPVCERVTKRWGGPEAITDQEKFDTVARQVRSNTTLARAMETTPFATML